MLLSPLFALFEDGCSCHCHAAISLVSLAGVATVHLRFLLPLASQGFGACVGACHGRDGLICASRVCGLFSSFAYVRFCMLNVFFGELLCHSGVYIFCVMCRQERCDN